jgi:hypothetical protein
MSLIVIAHRGNLNGADFSRENDPKYIDEAISAHQSIQVEVDIRYVDKKWYLGHDRPDHKVSFKWMKERNHRIWWHAKNLSALIELNRIDALPYDIYDSEDEFSRKQKFFYFWHQNDDYTLTSGGHIWTFPNKTIKGKKSILCLNSKDSKVPKGIFGICTDYPMRYL